MWDDPSDTPGFGGSGGFLLCPLISLYGHTESHWSGDDIDCGKSMGVKTNGEQDCTGNAFQVPVEGESCDATSVGSDAPSSPPL